MHIRISLFAAITEAVLKSPPVILARSDHWRWRNRGTNPKLIPVSVVGKTMTWQRDPRAAREVLSISLAFVVTEPGCALRVLSIIVAFGDPILGFPQMKIASWYASRPYQTQSGNLTDRMACPRRYDVVPHGPDRDHPALVVSLAKSSIFAHPANHWGVGE
jgi:hypothetical protein